MSHPWYQWRGDTLLLTVHAQPRARGDEVVGPHGDSLKVRISAPPVDGKANAHLVKFLASSFGVRPAAVQLISGDSSRNKRFTIENPTKIPKQAGISRI